MGGLIKWLKKDGSTRTSRRRESAPLQFWNKQKPTEEEEKNEIIRESLSRFCAFRKHDRIQRLSMGANELAAYQSISDDRPNYTGLNTTPTEQKQAPFQPNTCPPKPYRAESTVQTHRHNGRTKKISVQFQLEQSTDECDSNVTYRKSRHSMPAITPNSYKRSIRRTQNFQDSRTIEEIEEFAEEIGEFEANCMTLNEDENSSYRSPPMKFYKPNLDPFQSQSQSETSSLSTLGDPQPPHQFKCPEKPKRLLLNSKQSRKLLTEAHFTGAYRNFEIQSPYYSDSSSMVSSVCKKIPPNDTDSMNDGSSSSTPHYQVIKNKHGDEVEYALPFIDIPQYQRRQKLQNCMTSDDSALAGEIFHEDPIVCDQILNGLADSLREQSTFQANQQKNSRIMITDLDKSSESVNTHGDLDELDDRTPIGDMILHTNKPNRVLLFHDTMQCSDIVCFMSEFNSMGKMGAKIQTPLHFELGVFKKTNVTVRKYADLDDDETTADFTLIAETAIIRDAEIIRKHRHPNIINLMAIAFEPFRRLALVMEPTKYSLNHHIFVKNLQLDLIEVATVMKRISSAVQYLHEFGICHSNISSHTILVGENILQVKLSSFELAVPFESDVQEEVELKQKQQTKRGTPNRQKHSPRHSLSSEQKIQRYKKMTQAFMATRDTPNPTSSVPFIREISTKYFPYSVQYRRMLTMFNYQAPELLSQSEQFVFPMKQSDVYSLALLLWELLNKCITFVIYDEMKLDELLKTNYPLKFLPIIEEERCQRFNEILERGLKREPETRIELERMIRKLSTIETDLYRENDKSQCDVKCCCIKKPNGKTTQRRLLNKENAIDEPTEMTPDKSTSKLFSIITTPKPSPVTAASLNSAEKTVSPLNNVTNNTFYRSVLDFNKLLSPRRDTNDDTYQRSSTLKKRKKVTPVNNGRRNVKGLFGSVENTSTVNDQNDEFKTFIANGRDSDKFGDVPSSGRLSSEFNNALTKSAIYKELDYTNEEKSMTEPVVSEQPIKKKIDQPFGPKEVTNQNESEPKQQTEPANANNSSYQFIIDDYELPQELIARNNKIRRCTWLSSDQVNTSMQGPLVATATSMQIKSDEVSTLPTLNESSDSSKKLNVSIKIVHKQCTPDKNQSLNDSMKSDCSMASGASSEDSFSVKSRIKFFRSLESQPVQRRTPKNKMNASRRSEMSFNEAKKAIEKAQRNTYPSSKQPENLNQKLIQEITEITADIRNCLSNNKYLNEKKSDDVGNESFNHFLNANSGELEKSMSLLMDDILNQKSVLDENAKNESMNEESEKRNSVRETVQKFESSLRNDKSDCKSDAHKKIADFFDRGGKHAEVTDEKVEDVIRFEAPCEAENECGPILPVHADDEIVTASDGGNKQSQSLIKRTFYQESIISGTNMDMPELKTLLVNTPNVTTSYATTTKSSLTTHDTLNMRKCRRRSSDVGLIAHQQANFTNDAISSPRMVDVRHSICGSPLPLLNVPVEATSGRQLEQISNDRHSNHASGLMVSNNQLQTSVRSNVLAGIINRKQIQSIEDLYIDDDFAGISLAANMKLMTNSTDSLDNINFDLISTHIFEQTSESMMTTNTTNVDGNGITNAIEQGAEDAKNDQ